MTLSQLRAFLLVASLGTFSAAASELRMSQPSISELIKRMEVHFGLPLFTRGARRMSLTAAGEALMPYARTVVEGADGADRALRSMAALSGGVASFGLLRNANYYLLSELLETFHTHHPNVRLRIIGVNSVEVAQAVTAGDIEAGLVVLPVDTAGLTVTPLLRDEVLFASADESRCIRPVTIRDLAAANLVLYDAHYGWRDPTRRQVAERAQLEGITLEPAIEVEQVESALSLVSRGAADTIVSSAITRSATFPQNIYTVGFADPLCDTIALVHRSAGVLSPATQEFARLAHRTLLGE